MILGKVVGDVWSTKKKEEVNALRFLFVQPFGKNLTPKEELIVAADEIGAGIGETVIVTQGAPAMQAFNRDNLLPIDAVVIGIVDSLEMPE